SAGGVAGAGGGADRGDLAGGGRAADAGGGAGDTGGVPRASSGEAAVVDRDHALLPAAERVSAGGDLPGVLLSPVWADPGRFGAADRGERAGVRAGARNVPQRDRGGDDDGGGS